MNHLLGKSLVVSSLVLFLILFLAACSQTSVDVGQTQLTKQDFGTAGSDGGSGIAANATGVYVVGSTSGSLDGPNKGGSDAFLRKYDGGVVWGQQFGTRAFDQATDVAVDSAGNSYVVGNTEGALGFRVGGTDVFLRKYNSSGIVQWTRQFGTRFYDVASDVALDSSNNIFVLNLNQDAAAENDIGFTLRKYNGSGVLLTSRTVTSASLPSLSPAALAIDSTGNVVVLARWLDSAGGTSQNVRVFKFTNTLADVWNVPFQQTVNYEFANDIATFGTDIYLTARISSATANYGARYGKLNSAGTLVAVKQLEPTSTCNCTIPLSITVDSSGNIYIAGFTFGAFPGFTNAGFSDIVVFKYNTANTRIWVRQFGQGTFGTTEYDYGYGIAVSDAVYVTGYTYGNLLGDPKYSNPPINDTDAYLAQLDIATGAVLGIDQ
jgi:Beta-propeller repeat